MRLRWVVLVVLLVGSALVGLAARDAAAAADSLQQARDGLSADLADADADADALLARIDAASAQLDQAARQLSRPAPRIVAAVPLLGRSWDAERRAVEAGQAVLAGSRVVAQALPGLRTDDGAVDVTALQSLADELDTAAPVALSAWQELDAAATWGTPPVVADGVRDAADALLPAVSALQNGASGARVAAGLLGADGPRPILVGLQNNAELRGGGGYVSTFATGTTAAGRIELGPFRDVASVYDPLEQARQVPAPAEFRADFGVFLADTTYWRMWTMSPHVPDAAAVGAEVAEVLLDQRPSVVLLLDVPAVAALVDLTGQPVVLPGGQSVPADQLVEALLVDSYAEAGADEQEQQVRREALRASAGGAVAGLLGSGVDLAEAVPELGRLARGRHLAVWSAEPQEQAVLVELGLAGAVDARGADLLHVSVNNLTANKLDYYVDRQVEHEVQLGERSAEVRTKVRLTNTAPPGLVPYVAGITTPNRSSLRVEMSFSPSAEFRSLTVGGQAARGDVRFGELRARAFTYVDLGVGESVDVELRYTLATEGGLYRVTALPQALARDATLQVEVRGTDGQPLEAVEGLQVDGGVATRSGPWAEREQLTVVHEPPGRWERFREGLSTFWNEPVSLG